MSFNEQNAVSGGSLSETWKSHQEILPFSKYLLLLDHPETDSTVSHCSYMSKASSSLLAADSSSFYASRKLVLELLYPKLEELDHLCASWTKKASEGGTQVSLERFQSLFSACIIGTMLVPQVDDLNTSQSSSVEALLMDLGERSVAVAMGSVEPLAFVDRILRAARPCIPDINTARLGELQAEHSSLLHFLAKISDLVEQRQIRNDSGSSPDFMDVDDEFDSQNSRAGSASISPAIPRQTTQMDMSPRAFYLDTRKRLCLLQIIQRDISEIGKVPEAYVDELLLLSDDDLLSCQRLLIELFRSDLVTNPESALNIIERLGAIVSRLEYQCCEVALTTCIEVLDGLCNVWLHEGQQLAENAGDLYNHFIKVCLSSNIFSPKAKMSMARFLRTLLRADLGYGTSLGLDSCRTSLLYIFSNSPMRVKHFIAEWIADMFDLFVLMVHDEVFVDVLESLPKDSEDIAGIAFRLLVLSKMACRWPTLLRRCTYHIFETPGKISHSTQHANWCLVNISNTLKLESPKQLFQLFSRQLLYTWLESDPVEEIPFSIFGFENLAELLRSAQSEAIGLMIMRGQDDASAELAQHLGVSEPDLIQGNFTTALAYGMVFGDQEGGPAKGRGEEYIRKRLGNKLFAEALYINFVDIVALFFDLIDQEVPIERTFAKHPSLSYAGDALGAMKMIAHSPAHLPPNQQPTFRAKYVIHGLFRLCQSTEFQFHDLWTPALVVSIARKLLNTVHPALGSLHACSVLRKVRILVSLAGPVSLDSYCLEMLLNSTRSFIVDSECADDALGLSQYLLSEGSQYVSQTPSFLAGYALSILASLRVFLESSQSSTTQESQFKATMSKAQKFHEWFSKYLADYTSPMFKSEGQSEAFKSITQSAAHIRSSGNAEKDTFESKLLLGILKDEGAERQLLNESSRQLALGLLCGDFTIPAHVLDDIVESDKDAVEYATAVWRSCQTQDLSENYLSWAGRVVGRSFSANGDIPEGILRESRLLQYKKIAPGPNGSEMGLLCLLQDLTSDSDSLTVGLAEAALRTTVSDALLQEDEPLVVACQQSLAESLFLTSQWGSYRSPPSETVATISPGDGDSVWSKDIASTEWLPQLSAHLAKSVPESILLSVLPPILAKVKGFAEKAFPFIVHLVLYFQLERQQVLKQALSGAMKTWLLSKAASAKENLKLLINTVLYLRTQEYPKESSIADRLHWLDIDYASAASSASCCGMFKTALLFAELVSSESTRSSRRSSAVKELDVQETLLSIFENIDDPDAYYGLPEDASLSKVLARVEYENEGTKSLAFRGAQYDSHIRRRNPSSEGDGQALVKALSTLGLSGLSHSLLQTQQSIGTTPSSLESMFSTARRLEIWNLPAPASDHHAVTVYKAYQSMNQATNLSVVRSAVYEGFGCTMQSLTEQGLNATALRNQLAALAALSELDDVLNIKDSSELDGILNKFQSRGQWMRSGV